MSLSTSVHDDGGVRTITPAGEVDLATADDLRRAIDAATADRPTTVVIDLGAVTFMDSVGISALLYGRNTADSLAVGYRVVNPQPMVDQVLTLLQVKAHLNGESPAGSTG